MPASSQSSLLIEYVIIILSIFISLGVQSALNELFKCNPATTL